MYEEAKYHLMVDCGKLKIYILYPKATAKITNQL